MFVAVATTTNIPVHRDFKCPATKSGTKVFGACCHDINDSGRGVDCTFDIYLFRIFSWGRDCANA